MWEEKNGELTNVNVQGQTNIYPAVGLKLR